MKDQTDNRLVYDVPEAGALLGMSRQSAYAAAARGDLPTIRIGKLLRVPKAALEAMLNQVRARESSAG